MVNLKIKNIGPIKQAEFDLNKVNVFMGPQSSGKSTIAKISSQCSWCEKNFILTEDEYDFFSGLVEFHNMDEDYFYEDSEIIYESQWVKIVFTGKENETFYTKKEQKTDLYKNLKIEYIPAERNFVASIPNLNKYSEVYNNIINFLNDWNVFKETITKKGMYSSPLQTLDVNYKYDTKEKKDVLALANNKEILLHKSSSGQQSIIPLLVVCEYMFKTLYNQKRISSSVEQRYIKSKLPDSIKADYEWLVKEESFPNKTKSSQDIEFFKKTKENIWNAIGTSFDYDFSNVIIEEPEQNLFPETQKELTYYLMNMVNDNNRNHKMVLTTHSPYILYALNNCLLGGLVKDNVPDDESFQSKASWINPKLVSVWEIEDGYIRNIQDNDNVISENYFDLKMTELTDEYFQILNYYQDEE